MLRCYIHWNLFHYDVLHYGVLYHSVLHCCVLHYSVLHYGALHYNYSVCSTHLSLSSAVYSRLDNDAKEAWMQSLSTFSPDLRALKQPASKQIKYHVFYEAKTFTLREHRVNCTLSYLQYTGWVNLMESKWETIAIKHSYELSRQACSSLAITLYN